MILLHVHALCSADKLINRDAVVQLESDDLRCFHTGGQVSGVTPAAPPTSFIKGNTIRLQIQMSR